MDNQPAVEIIGAMIEPGKVTCPWGELVVETYPVTDPDKSLQIGGVETVYSRIVIRCVHKAK